MSLSFKCLEHIRDKMIKRELYGISERNRMRVMVAQALKMILTASLNKDSFSSESAHKMGALSNSIKAVI